MGCRLPGEPGRGGHAAVGTCTPYPQLLESKGRQGAREPKALAKGWGVQEDREVKQRGLAGRMKESGRGCVLVKLWSSVIGVRGEKKERKVCQGREDQDSDEIETIGTIFGGLISVVCCNFKKEYYLPIYPE